MRKIIASLQVSADGFIEGPNGELDWASMAEDEETWAEVNEMLNSVDAFILGRVMYPDYDIGWRYSPTRRERRMRMLMHSALTRCHIYSSQRLLTKLHGRRQGSLGTLRKSE